MRRMREDRAGTRTNGHKQAKNECGLEVARKVSNQSGKTSE